MGSGKQYVCSKCGYTTHLRVLMFHHRFHRCSEQEDFIEAAILTTCIVHTMAQIHTSRGYTGTCVPSAERSRLARALVGADAVGPNTSAPETSGSSRSRNL